jgi:dipeptidase
VLFGHNEDNGFASVSGMEYSPRAEHPEGEWVTLRDGGRVPQVRTTFAYRRIRMPERLYSDTFVNEYGVALASDACNSREDRPDLTDGGIGGPILRILVMERARTAREGVELAGRLIGQFGYIASGRTMVICDPNEGWLVALVNGKHWVARRVPDGEVAPIANTYTIREIDLRDTKNFLGSSDIVDYAVSRGWHDPAKGSFSFEAAYADPKTRENIVNTHRQWSALNRLSAKPVPLPEKERLPFSVKPKRPLTVADISAVLRDHYEHTPYDPADYGEKTAHKRHTSTICGPWTNTSSIFQLRSGMPPAVGALWWLAFRQPCTTPYIPFHFGMKETPEEMAFLTNPSGYVFGSTAKPPEPGPLYTALGDLAEWTNGDYAGRITAVRAWRDASEKASGDFLKPFEAFILGEWKRDPEAASEQMARYSRGVVARTLHDVRMLNGVSGPALPAGR